MSENKNLNIPSLHLRMDLSNRIYLHLIAYLNQHLPQVDPELQDPHGKVGPWATLGHFSFPALFMGLLVHTYSIEQVPSTNRDYIILTHCMLCLLTSRVYYLSRYNSFDKMRHKRKGAASYFKLQFNLHAYSVLSTFVLAIPAAWLFLTFLLSEIMPETKSPQIIGNALATIISSCVGILSVPLFVMTFFRIKYEKFENLYLKLELMKQWQVSTAENLQKINNQLLILDETLPGISDDINYSLTERLRREGVLPEILGDTPETNFETYIMLSKRLMEEQGQLAQTEDLPLLFESMFPSREGVNINLNIDTEAMVFSVEQFMLSRNASLIALAERLTRVNALTEAQSAELWDYCLSKPLDTKKYLQILEDISRIDTLKISNARERTERKILISTLCNSIEELYGFLRNSYLLRSEIVGASRPLTQQLNKELRWLQREATAYFTDMFLRDNLTIINIEFLDKVIGVQMGNRMLITYVDSEDIEHRRMIYLKTHQHGSARRGGSTLTPVDLKELYFYKVLEYTGFGPKAYFLYNAISPSGFYIATQDQGFTNNLDKNKFFNTYSMAEEELDSRQDLSSIVRIGVARAEILLRVFFLWDITDNSGNYGFVRVNGKEKWRVIDFRVETRDDYHLQNVFEDYRVGVGINAVSLPGRVLHSEEERLKLANFIVDEFEQGQLCQSREGRKAPLLEAMERAFNEVSEYAKAQNDALQLDLGTVLPDLDSYHTSVRDNLHCFGSNVRECSVGAPNLSLEGGSVTLSGNTTA